MTAVFFGIPLALALIDGGIAYFTRSSDVNTDIAPIPAPSLISFMHQMADNNQCLRPLELYKIEGLSLKQTDLSKFLMATLLPQRDQDYYWIDDLCHGPVDIDKWQDIQNLYREVNRASVQLGNEKLDQVNNYKKVKEKYKETTLTFDGLDKRAFEKALEVLNEEEAKINEEINKYQDDPEWKRTQERYNFLHEVRFRVSEISNFVGNEEDFRISDEAIKGYKQLREIRDGLLKALQTKKDAVRELKANVTKNNEVLKKGIDIALETCRAKRRTNRVARKITSGLKEVIVNCWNLGANISQFIAKDIKCLALSKKHNYDAEAILEKLHSL